MIMKYEGKILICIVAIALIVSSVNIYAKSDVPIRQEIANDEDITLEKAELQILIEKAVSKRIQPLQRELTAMKEEIRFHDILGGIGYIVGIMGITFYFFGVKKREKLLASENDNKEQDI